MREGECTERGEKEVKDDFMQMPTSINTNNVATGGKTATTRDAETHNVGFIGDSDLNLSLKRIFDIVSHTERYNFAQARCTVPSALNIGEWRRRLVGYRDTHLADYLQYGWPVNYDRFSPLWPTYKNHPSATQHEADVDHYIHNARATGLYWGHSGDPQRRFSILAPL